VTAASHFFSPARPLPLIGDIFIGFHKLIVRGLTAIFPVSQTKTCHRLWLCATVLNIKSPARLITLATLLAPSLFFVTNFRRLANS